MGRIKEKPRYNVISVRVDDEFKERLATMGAKRGLSEFFREALEEKLARMISRSA